MPVVCQVVSNKLNCLSDIILWKAVYEELYVFQCQSLIVFHTFTFSGTMGTMGTKCIMEPAWQWILGYPKPSIFLDLLPGDLVDDLFDHVSLMSQSLAIVLSPVCFPGRFCRVKGNGWWLGQYRWYYYQCTNRRPIVALRESISRGYPFFFFVRKGQKYFFYSVLFIHVSPYSEIN